MKTFEAHRSGRVQKLQGVPLATFPARATAFLIDLFLILLLVILVGLPGAWRAKQSGAAEHLVIPFKPFDSLWGLVALVSYFGVLTYFARGRTVGKRLLGIRVVSLTHERVTLWQSCERALGYAASALEAGFGFIQYFLHPNRQTVHDRIAETIVVAEPKA